MLVATEQLRRKVNRWKAASGSLEQIAAACHKKAEEEIRSLKAHEEAAERRGLFKGSTSKKLPQYSSYTYDIRLDETTERNKYNAIASVIDNIGTEILVEDMTYQREQFEISVNVAQVASKLIRRIGCARPYPHRYRNVAEQPPPCTGEPSSSGLPGRTQNSSVTEPPIKAARTDISPAYLWVDKSLQKYLHTFEPVSRFRGFVKKWGEGVDNPWIASKPRRVYEFSLAMLIALRHQGPM